MTKSLAILVVIGCATAAHGAVYTMNFVDGVGGADLGSTLSLATIDSCPVKEAAHT